MVPIPSSYRPTNVFSQLILGLCWVNKVPHSVIKSRTGMDSRRERQSELCIFMCDVTIRK